MARVAGVDLPPNKRAEVGLTYIYGIGRKRSNDILLVIGIGNEYRRDDGAGLAVAARLRSCPRPRSGRSCD